MPRESSTVREQIDKMRGMRRRALALLDVSDDIAQETRAASHQAMAETESAESPPAPPQAEVQDAPSAAGEAPGP